MKNILLSTALISALTLSFIGCGSSSSTKKVLLDDKQDNKTIVVGDSTNIGEKSESQTRNQVIEMKTTQAFALSDYTISKISGADKDKFLLINGEINFKSLYTPAGDYDVTLMLIDANNNIVNKDLTIKVNEKDAFNPVDNQAPAFSLPRSMNVASSIALNASNESGVVTYTTNSHSFTINNSTLTAPATAGDYNLTVHAEDSLGNASDVSTTINVKVGTLPIINNNNTAKGFYAQQDDSRYTWKEANNACKALGYDLPTYNELKSKSTQVVNLIEPIINRRTGFVVFTKTDGDTGFWVKSDGTIDSIDINKTSIIDDDKYNYICIKR